MKTLTLDELIKVRDKTLIYNAELERLTKNIKLDQQPLKQILKEYFRCNFEEIRISFYNGFVSGHYETHCRGESDIEPFQIPLSVCTSVNDIRKYCEKVEAEAEAAREAAEEKAENERERIHYEYLKQKFDPK